MATVLVQGENGLVIEHDLPLSPALEKRLAKGEVFIVPADPEPEAAARRGRPPKSEA